MFQYIEKQVTSPGIESISFQGRHRIWLDSYLVFKLPPRFIHRFPLMRGGKSFIKNSLGVSEMSFVIRNFKSIETQMMPVITILTLIFLIISGCSIFNPYESEFKCEATDTGRCGSVESAYEESLETSSQKTRSLKRKRKSLSSSVLDNELKDPTTTDLSGLKDEKEEVEIDESSEEEEYPFDFENIYKRQVFDHLSSLAKLPNPPVDTQAKTVRFLVLPYSDKHDNLYWQRFIYFRVTPPRWVFDKYGYFSKKTPIQ